MTDLLSAFAAVDSSWWEQAPCWAWVRTRWTPTPWTVSTDDEPVDGVPAVKMVDYALIVCSTCPVQYTCARTGVMEGHCAGTRAMRVRQMLWLRKQWDWESIIDGAEADGVPVQVRVGELRPSGVR